MNRKAVVAGHICIDITPSIPRQASAQIGDILSPGKLIHVGAADIHPGGAVANTGLAMKFFGADVTLAGKIGDDAFGDLLVRAMEESGGAKGLIRKEGEHTSYSIVVAVPGVDRIFLHDPGANDTFCADDLPMQEIREAALFHFGYPPIMKRMYQNAGAELAQVMKMAHDAGAATSLDMAAVDPASEAGQADWEGILSWTLPYVDIFVPSVEEMLFMLERDKYERIRAACPGDITEVLSAEDDVFPLARRCIDLGAKIVLMKCGAPGLGYMSAGKERVCTISPRLGLDPQTWADLEGFERSYLPEKILSGTGAGDTCIAAFLTAMLEGCSPQKCIQYAAATGACCVQAYDALSGLLPFEQLEAKIAAGWEKR